MIHFRPLVGWCKDGNRNVVGRVIALIENKNTTQLFKFLELKIQNIFELLKFLESKLPNIAFSKIVEMCVFQAFDCFKKV